MPDLDKDYAFTCPFVRGGDTRPHRARITCDRFDEASIHLYTRHKERLNAFVGKYCGGDFTKCIIYRALMTWKYDEEPWESFNSREEDDE